MWYSRNRLRYTQAPDRYAGDSRSDTTSQEGINFVVTVHLPSTTGGAPLSIKNFETYMPAFIHYIGDLEGSVFFDSISLHTSNMPIVVKVRRWFLESDFRSPPIYMYQSLAAKSISMFTDNSPIEGSFNASHNLDLSTSNAPIKVNLGLSNRDAPGCDPTRVRLNTFNRSV